MPNQIEIYRDLKNEGVLSPTPPMGAKSLPYRNNGKYCEYHQDQGHTTDERRTLAREIEKYQAQEKLPGPPKTQQNLRGTVFMIMGGEANKRKAQEGKNNVKKSKTTAIYFSDEDTKEVKYPHQDPLVISPIINEFIVQRVLVDTGASVDVMYWDAFKNLGLEESNLTPYSTSIKGFGQMRIPVAGTITLPITLGEGKMATTRSITFTVVRFNSGYNVILGRVALHQFEAVSSSYHQCMKFPSTRGICCVKGSQPIAKTYYINTNTNSDNAILGRKRRSSEVMQNNIPGYLKNKEEKEIPTTNYINVEVGKGKELKIGKQLSAEEKHILTEILRRNLDISAWELGQIRGIDRSIVEHKLCTNTAKSPIKQKLRTLSIERKEAAVKEIEKLLQEGFIREVKYPRWLSNIVMVKKPDGRWRICVDFTNLNLACPKDSYPLPSIDVLVDRSVGYKMLSFMDVYSGYNQVKMCKKDEEKTAFITEMGTFCYTVMPFGLKNARTTFQRLVDKVFRKQTGKNIETYVDDILVKSKNEKDHWRDLEETFEKIRRSGINLKPEKCTFGVTEGKFLGYIISPERIKPQPKKIEAIRTMRPPKNLKEVQRLNGRIAALGRFIPKNAEKCGPFFNILHNPGRTIKWDDKCGKAFEELKRILAELPTLHPPTSTNPLFLYVSCSETTVSAVLVTENDKNQKPVFYLSKTLQGAEHRYPPLEKLALAIVVSARRLRIYFQSYQIIVPTSYPLLQTLHKPEISGRLAKWAIELSGYDIKFIPAKAIKAQALADFIAELGPSTEVKEEIEEIWSMKVDGATGKNGCGAGIILQGPDELRFEHVIHFNFKSTNNKAEYETLLTGLELEKEIGVRKLEVFAYSQLVANQLKGTFEIKEKNLQEYH